MRWTNKELVRAAELWRDGHTHVDIAVKLNRTLPSLKSAVHSNRALFPFRNSTPESGNSEIRLRFTISKFLDQKLKAEAKQQNISKAQLIRKILRKAML